MSLRHHVARGLVGGFIAAAVFAAWFLLLDLVRSEPLQTPVYLGRAILASTQLSTGASVAIFTVLHFAAFGIAGIIASLLLEAAEIQPGIGLGMVFGFLLFDIAFYSSVLVIGGNVVRELGWPKVLSGNVLAGIALFGYLRAAAHLPLWNAGAVLRSHTTLRYGLITGIVGASVVAAWFFIIDAVRGHLLYTPAALGSALLSGASSPGEVTVTASVVLAYTVVHFTAFILLGILVAHIAEQAEQNPPLLIGLVLFFVTLEVLSLGLLSAAAAWLFLTVPWWSLIVANLLAAGGMVGYLWHVHPTLHERVRQPLEDHGLTPRRA
ncbi:MAG TPA: hypothetical protein VF021_08600 [Longimicrobiales bacterium]